MMKSFVAAIVIAAFSSVAAAMEPALLVRMTDSQLDQVVAGAYPTCQPVKGNNGWGNGADPSNPGSPHGKTAPSKMANGTAGPGVNTNPTRSSGR